MHEKELDDKVTDNEVIGNMEASGAGVDERMRTDSCGGNYWLQANRWDWVESRQVKVCCSRLWSPDQMWPGDREPVTEGPLGLARRVHVSPRYDQAGRG